MQKYKITSIGEILFDVYPDEKNIGGAPFNFIYHIIKIAGRGNFISRIGNDELGKEILQLMSKNNIESGFIQIDDEHPTGTAIANLDAEKIPHWKIEEERAYDFINQTKDLKKIIKTETSCLYFGTLAQRNGTTRKTIQSLFNEKIKFFCDLNIRQKFYSKEIIEKSLYAANVLKLNIDELKIVNDLLMKATFHLEDGNNYFEMEKLAKQMIDTFGIELLCITLGEDGAILINANETNHFKIKVDEIVDTVGAGDAYAAVLCLGYLRGWSLETINLLATSFAADVVKIKGALPDDEMFYDKIKRDICDIGVDHDEERIGKSQ
jgi:fructokinase